MKKHLTIFLCCLFFMSACIPPPVENQVIQHSDSSYVKMYSFQQFLDKQTINPGYYKLEFSKQLKYPPIYRENHISGAVQYLLTHAEDGTVDLSIRSLIVNNGKGETYSDPITGKYFLRLAQKTLEDVNAIYLEKSNEKYQTTFTIFYDSYPHEKNKSIYDKYDFVVIGEEVVYIEKRSH